MTLVRRALIVAAVAALGLSISPALASSSSAAAPAACRAMGSTEVAGRTVVTCQAFYTSGPAIRVPADTATVVYGVLSEGTLKTRSGDIPVAGSAWKQYASTFGLLIKARITKGTAVDPRPVVLVSQRAVLAPLAGQHSHAAIEWMSPPDGVGDADALVAFTSRTSASILNYHRAASIEGHCMPAIAATAAEKSAYAPFFGKGTLAVFWNPGMHSPTDSEIVLDSRSGPSWMSPGPQIVDLLTGPWKPTEVSFRIHANPIGTPATLEGPLMPGTTATRC